MGTSWHALILRSFPESPYFRFLRWLRQIRNHELGLKSFKKSPRFAKVGKWELPGGGVDWILRETILRAGQRELWEETGLDLASFDDYVGQYQFQAPWMLWMKDNLKIIFIGSVKDGDEGLKNIRLSPMEHEAFCWATESQIKEMSLHAEKLALVMDGCEAMPKPDQWKQMAFISEEGKHYAIEAFNRLRN
ncbi:hypothetical protein TSTA_111060 [Talaromyces stipitatus ATCC 10500]|uniref:Nudix hydrolase domain-containing protein n=1 Tax=Talaromyces stipitatus (strain ATCC 10500 / CBS 375.48 / QM 6759 / NRRL 1006) TaxID=441959 RepID=B8MU73_TALSN|nr:uncharacterized protein TSTA_111060 [Talaromyces stipitatus ATCC 10500]XP_002488852.1 uncharacterized protein TSTA_080530 [Talaromyces stipitatus ATCC 10500]EED11442.1 hypothetical protein TSTA_080530 [Talaromyces stipitatus ATCC 10500]EED11929.1 hypothetical protein TSTA_111060 [Talaromyces stipitatus ATCC 10500]